MSVYVGDFLAGKTVRCPFNTVDSSNNPASLTGGAVVITKNGADVTPSGGVTLTANAGSVTGLNTLVIDMSVDVATFTAGAEYSARLSGSSAVGATSAVGRVVGEWSVANRSVAVDSLGVVSANVVKVAGTSAFPYDGIFASATTSTVTFPATDAGGNTIPDDHRYAFTKFYVIGGTGQGQMGMTTTPTGTALQYNLLASTVPHQLDNTSQYILLGTAISEIDMTQAVPVTNTDQTIGDAFNAARAQGFGKWTWVGTTLTLYASDGTTAVKTFTLDSSTTPRQRS